MMTYADIALYILIATTSGFIAGIVFATAGFEIMHRALNRRK